jgi:hypothetical protein
MIDNNNNNKTFEHKKESFIADLNKQITHLHNTINKIDKCDNDDELLQVLMNEAKTLISKKTNNLDELKKHINKHDNNPVNNNPVDNIKFNIYHIRKKFGNDKK